MTDHLSPEDRNKYVQEYARFLDVPADPFSIAAKIIQDEKAFTRACLFIFGLTKQDPEQLNYARKAARYLEEYLGDNYKEIDANWLYQFVTGYVQNVDTSYKW